MVMARAMLRSHKSARSVLCWATLAREYCAASRFVTFFNHVINSSQRIAPPVGVSDLMSLDRRAALVAVLCICLSKYECMNMLRAVSALLGGGTDPEDVECDNTVPS